jgi:hypothetical protein
MRTIKYEETDKANTETLIATDESMEHKFGNIQLAYNEGFAASEGVRGETAETNGRVKHPETKDSPKPNTSAESVQSENSGLADN